MKIFQFNNLLAYKNIKQGVSTREFGSMKNEDGSSKKEDLNVFLKELNISSSAITMGQVHGSNVIEIKDINVSRVENTDGMITAAKNTPLTVLTADCLPIVFYDPKKQIIGIVHGGRKGLYAGIIENTIDKLKSEFNSDPKNIIVGIGPGIEKKCYEVDSEFIDIRKIAHNALVKIGIKEENIEDMDICTKCNMDKFYSYRGGDLNSRFASVISLNK